MSMIAHQINTRKQQFKNWQKMFRARIINIPAYEGRSHSSKSLDRCCRSMGLPDVRRIERKKGSEFVSTKFKHQNQKTSNRIPIFEMTKMTSAIVRLRVICEPSLSHTQKKMEMRDRQIGEMGIWNLEPNQDHEPGMTYLD